MKRALIAGLGDLGGRVGIALAEAGWSVTALRRSAAQRPGLQTVQADLSDATTLRDLGQPDAVVFCPTPDERTPAGYQRVFVDGLCHLLGALGVADRRRRLLFVSSTAVYAQDEGEWIEEQSAADPVRFNGRVLRLAENLAAASGWSACALRLGGLYGPGRERLIESVRSGQARCQDDPVFWTNRIHIEDAASLAVHLLNRQALPPVVNGVDHCPAAQCEVMDFLAERLGAPKVARQAGRGAGKRVVCRALGEGELDLQYPDYRSGYGELLANAGR